MTDPLRFAPNPNALVSKTGEDEEGGDGVYRPPKMLPTSMDYEVGGKDAKELRRSKEQRRRAGRSQLIKVRARIRSRRAHLRLSFRRGAKRLFAPRVSFHEIVRGFLIYWRKSHVPNLGQGAARFAVGEHPIKSWTFISARVVREYRLTRLSHPFFAHPQELAREVGEAPEEVGLGDEDLVQSAFAKREMARMEARARVEEDLFTRVPLSKQERRRQKASTRNVNSLAAVGDFGDDVADLVERTEELDKVSRKRRLVDTVTEGYKKPSQDITSGEQDVPLRDTLGVSIFAFSLARFIASYRSFGCFPLHDRPGSKLMPHSNTARFTKLVNTLLLSSSARSVWNILCLVE